MELRKMGSARWAWQEISRNVAVSIDRA